MRKLNESVRSITICSSSIRKITYYEASMTLIVHFWKDRVGSLSGVTEQMFVSLADAAHDESCDFADCLLMFSAENSTVW